MTTLIVFSAMTHQPSFETAMRHYFALHEYSQHIIGKTPVFHPTSGDAIANYITLLELFEKDLDVLKSLSAGLRAALEAKA